MKELEEGSAFTLDFNKLTKAIATCPGVIPVAVQHADTREVILVAYTNEARDEESHRRTHRHLLEHLPQ
jgi:phosphoribosyl-AMP cyclohydrolase